jgi:hypothetical protein
MRRLLRSVTAQDLAFWRAFEEVEGPIGYGPLVRIAAWLGGTQFDLQKTSLADLFGWLTEFMQNPLGEEEAEEDEVDEEAIEAAREALARKVMGILKHPEAAK